MIYDLFTARDTNQPDCVENFLTYLSTIKGKSVNTVKGYRSDLTVFFRFLLLYKRKVPGTTPFNEVSIKDISVDFIETITLNDLYAFLMFVEQYRKNGNYARARKVATLKSFYQYLYAKEKIIKNNPAMELESPKINKRHPIHLTVDQSMLLLQTMDAKKKNYPRDYCILTLFLNCGLRLSELCSIRISRIKGDTLSIVGKGNKERTIYLNDSCMEAIQSYLESRVKIKTEEGYKDTLFLSTHNRPISPRTVELMVKNRIKEAGITDAERITPHKLRHTAATILYQNGVDIRKLQAILGHESISTTEIYTHIDDQALRTAVKSNPLNKIRGCDQ